MEEARVEDAGAGRQPLPEVEKELCTLAGQIAAASSRFLVLLADFDRREGWAGVGVKSCAHWLSWRCGLDLRTAREHVRVARALAGLPVVSEAFGAGRLSYSKVRAIVRVATPESERDLVDSGLQCTAAQVERLTRGLDRAAKDARQDAAQGLRSLGVEPDGAIPGMPPPPDPQEDQPYLQWRWDDDGRLALWGRLDPVEGAQLLAAAARTQVLADQPGPDGSAEPPAPSDPSEPSEPSEACRVSADCRAPRNLAGPVSVMAQTVLATVEAPRFAPAAEVTVLVGLDELQAALGEQNASADEDLANRPADPAGAAGPDPDDEAGVAEAMSHGRGRKGGRRKRCPRGARLQDGPALRRAALRRLVDDGRLRTAVLAGDGRTLDLGRRSRRLSKPQLVTLWRRDGGCRAPGCTRTRFLHAHHVLFWGRGGRSTLDNVLLLCGEHHRDLHLGRFRIAALGEQRFAFRKPDGTPWLVAPTVTGELAGLAAAHPAVRANSLAPEGFGGRLNLSLAVGTHLETWAQQAEQARRRAGLASLTPPAPGADDGPG